ncbi:MAG: nucleoside deaminase [Candidatus Melainabacteria bacterium]|nr:nucleoside deaminase [Candidatus Melainabacteria bacterium]
MSCAIDLVKNVKDEIPVCALVVRDNKLISKAVNKTEACLDATAHAEIIAIREASEILSNWRLNKCVLYSTLEPCAMCMGAILNSRISRLVFGAYDLNAGACGSVINLPKDLNKQNQIEIIGGINELEASQLLKDFFSLRR